MGQEAVRNTSGYLVYRGGTTRTNTALDTARTDVFEGGPGERPGVPNICVIITDGVPFPTDLRDPTIIAAERLQTICTCFVVGITSNVDVELLERLSSPPRLLNQNYFASPDFAQLGLILDSVLAGVCVTTTSTTTTPPTTITTTTTPTTSTAEGR